MSVEDIQKVNKLAQELLDQKIIESREEAVQKAQEMLNKEIVGDNIQIKETDDRQNVAAAGNSEERLRNIIERTKEYMEKQFAGYKNALMALEREIRALQQQVEELKSKAQSSSQERIPEEPSEPEQKQEPEKQEQLEESEKKSEGEPHPKRGNYNPDDVSVEKMFYFGNK